MREVHRRQFQIGQVPIEKIWINPKSRDDIPAVLKGLQYIWSDEKLRARLFALLDEHIVPETDRTVGRPGMELWQVLVLGVLKQGLGCDFDRLHDLANHHETIRAFLGHSDFGDRTRYEYQRVVDNVSLLTPELLSAVGQLVVESGHKVAKKKPGEPLRGRCDSFVVETDVHYPTDVSLLWDAMRCLLRETGRASGEHAVGGWRQWRYLTREVRSLFHRVRSTRRAKRHPERVEAYLARCRGLVERAVDTLDALRNPGVDAVTCDSIEGYVAHALRQIDQVERRLVRGETIPHEEKVFSIFEEHTRWVSKGKAGTPVELGVPVALIEDQYQFILHHEILWQGADVDVAVPLVQKAQARYPALRACSFDRGFHSPDNRVGLDALLDLNALPKKGRLSNVDREREEEASFAAARRVHPAIESAINGLEHRGLDRVRHHGVDGFARAVALSVLATNLHRIGLILQKRERQTTTTRRLTGSDRRCLLCRSSRRPRARPCRRRRQAFRADSLLPLSAELPESQSQPRSIAKSRQERSASLANLHPRRGFLADTNPSLPTTNLSHFRISGLRRQKCPSGTTNAYEPGKSVGQTSVLRTPPGCGSTPSAS